MAIFLCHLHGKEQQVHDAISLRLQSANTHKKKAAAEEGDDETIVVNGNKAAPSSAIDTIP